MSDQPVKAKIVVAGPNDVGQRIDNFLLRQLKGVPKTRIYKALRKGEVRVNGGRKKPTYHLEAGDQVRVPPIRHSAAGAAPVIPPGLLDHIPILFEDEHMLVVDKPSGLAVHGGSGMDYGLIEAMRVLRGDDGFLELVHRLDRETSGCLMLARSRPALVALQAQLSKQRSIRKHYVALVQGQFSESPAEIKFRLGNVRDQRGMQKMVRDDSGQTAHSVFKLREKIGHHALMEVDLRTGRMHQARVHAALAGHPIAGDRMYGDRRFNRELQRLGLGRLFLHAERLRIQHPLTEQVQDFHAPVPEALQVVLASLHSDNAW